MARVYLHSKLQRALKQINGSVWHNEGSRLMLFSFSPCILLLQHSLSPCYLIPFACQVMHYLLLCFPRIDLFSLFYPTLLDSTTSLGWDAAAFTFFMEQPMGPPSWGFEHSVPSSSAQSHHHIQEESCNSSSGKSQRKSLGSNYK